MDDVSDLPEPNSRKEMYLARAAGMDIEELPIPESREELYLNAIAANGGGGGGGGTTNYNFLTNKPKINNTTLSGNKIAPELGLQGTLISGSNIKTINNESILGSGNIDIDTSGQVVDVYWDDASTLNQQKIAELYSEVSVGSTTPDKRQKIWIDTSAADVALKDLASDSTHRLVTDSQISAWNAKQDALVSGTNIKTVNNESLLGSGNIDIAGGSVYLLTSEDFNWNSTAGSATEPYDCVAMWKLDAGLYYTTSTENIAVLIDADGDYLTPNSELALVSWPQSGLITGNNVSVTIIDGGGNNSFPVYKVNPTTGALNASTKIPFGNLPTVVDNLTNISPFAALSANQGRVLKNLIDGLVISGAGAPTTSTVGVVGTLYEDTTNGKLYQCTAVTAQGTTPETYTYTWADVRSYNDLTDKPRINNIPITGNKTPQMYGLQPAGSYASNPTITTNQINSTISFTLNNNTEYRNSLDMLSITLTLPSTIDNLYTSWLVFSSGTTATSISYPNTIIWSGDDITNGAFIPVANKIYNVAFWYDGLNVNAVVRGV